MKITKAEFVISAVKPEQFPSDALPEIALAGRSNVGKSSLINSLINRKNLARTSSKPGKTQTINFYRINESFYFTDVPGYGYAKVSKSERARWGKMMETYFTTRETLMGVLHIIDLRHPPTNDDCMMYNFLKYYEIPVTVIATKADKVPRGKWQKHLKQIRQGLEIRLGDELQPYSSETKQNKEEVLSSIFNLLNLGTHPKKSE
jgi:GTP-binding protein